jgi:hypothetical protein
MGPVASSAALMFSQKAETEGVKGVTGAGTDNPETSSSDLTDSESFLALVAALFPQAAVPPVSVAEPPGSANGIPSTASPAPGATSPVVGPVTGLIGWNVTSGMPKESPGATVKDSAPTQQFSPGAIDSPSIVPIVSVGGESPVVTAATQPAPTNEVAVAATSPAPSGVPNGSIVTAPSTESASPQSPVLRDGPVENTRETLSRNNTAAIPDRAIAPPQAKPISQEAVVADGFNVPPTVRAPGPTPNPTPLDDDEPDLVTDATAVVEGAVEFREVGTVTEAKEVPRPAERVTLETLADRLPQRIAEHLGGLRETGRAEVQMNLHPPELGKIQLHLKLEDGNMHIQMTVQSDGAKKVLDQQLEPLRVRFSEMGVGIGQFDVRRDGSGLGSGPTKEETDEIIIGAAGRRRPLLAAAYVSAPVSSSLIDVLA